MVHRSSLYLLIIGYAYADFAGSASVVNSLAAGLSSQVNAWSSPDGLMSALGIQNAFPTLSSAVGSLSSVAGTIGNSDVDPSGVNALASSIESLLTALSVKAADFNSVGALQIVQNDITSLQGPSVDIVQDIINAVSGDCAKIGSLTDALNGIAGGFSSADSAYSIGTSSFPSAPSCSASSSAAPSSATASPVAHPPVAPSSVAPSSVAPSSVAPSSVAPSSVAPSSVAPSSVAPSSVAPSSTAPSSAAPSSAAPSSAAPSSAAPSSVAPPSSIGRSSSIGHSSAGHSSFVAVSSGVSRISSSVIRSAVSSASGVGSTVVPSIVSGIGSSTPPIVTTVISHSGSNYDSTSGSGGASVPGGSTVTTVVSFYTTYCPSPTTIVTNGASYTVSSATTLTITNCPCTVTSVRSGVTSPGGPKDTGTAVPSTNPVDTTAVVPINGAASGVVGLGAIVAGAAAFLL